MTPLAATQLRLLESFMADAPSQPATNFWRCVELPVLAAALPAEGRGLDVGCGDGVLTKILRDLRGARWTLVGLDPVAAETALAERSGLYERVHTSGADNIPEPDASCDFVFANSVLEHIPGLSTCLGEMARCLKPGGLFAATVPSAHFHDCLRSREWAEIDERLAHFHYWSEDRWHDELRTAGLAPLALADSMSLCEVRRWEAWSNATGGLLYRLSGRRKKPVAIQFQLGIRRGLPRTARWLAKPLARLVGHGLFGHVDPDPAHNGGSLVLAHKPRG